MERYCAIGDGNESDNTHAQYWHQLITRNICIRAVWIRYPKNHSSISDLGNTNTERQHDSLTSHGEL